MLGFLGMWIIILSKLHNLYSFQFCPAMFRPQRIQFMRFFLTPAAEISRSGFRTNGGVNLAELLIISLGAEPLCENYRLRFPPRTPRSTPRSTPSLHCTEYNTALHTVQHCTAHRTTLHCTPYNTAHNRCTAQRTTQLPSALHCTKSALGSFVKMAVIKTLSMLF